MSLNPLDWKVGAAVADVASTVGNFASGFVAGVGSGAWSVPAGVWELIKGFPDSVGQVIAGMKELAGLLAHLEWDEGAKRAFPDLYRLATGVGQAERLRPGLPGRARRRPVRGGPHGRRGRQTRAKDSRGHKGDQRLSAEETAR